MEGVDVLKAVQEAFPSEAFDIKRMELSQGDLLVLSTPFALSDETCGRIVAKLRAAGIENKVLVLGDDMKLGVLAPAGD